ncbi:DENN domain-containing protein 11 isoform X2 [Mustelus asterias]
MTDRAPLLEYEEGPSVTFPSWDGTSPAAGNGAGLAPGVSGGGAAESWSPGSEREAAATPGAQQQEEEEEQVVAVFVVTFDTRAGNIVEWCLPHEVDLEGVEFKSMASGSHRINSDFVHQLEIPGHYAQLEAFYEDKKGVLPSGINKGIPTSLQPLHWLPTVNKYMYPEMKITHPAGCMSQFIKFFGEQIMVLWKFALLRKRILIFSPPPVGVVCYRVYCCCCLANVSLPGIGGVPESKPYFYISVADIETLETEVSYVACTTEKIFEEKKDLYDVYVDNQNVKTDREHLQQLLKINSADKDKYRKLNDQRQMLLYSQEVGGDCSSSEEDLFIMFFMEQNNRIFQMLLEVSACQDKTLTADHVRSMGLDPQGDRIFLMDLLEVYGIDVMLVIDNPCCP